MQVMVLSPRFTQGADAWVHARVVGDIVPERRNLRVGDEVRVMIRPGTGATPPIGTEITAAFTSITNDEMYYYPN